MGKIIYTGERNGYEYESDRGIKYSLYEGKSIKGETSSDVVFVMLDSAMELDEVLGDMDYMYVGWFFGAGVITDESFVNSAIDILDHITKEYEDKHPEVVEYFNPTPTEDEIKEMISTVFLKYITDYSVQTVLRRVLYWKENSINWTDFYENIMDQMPELKKREESKHGKGKLSD